VSSERSGEASRDRKEFTREVLTLTSSSEIVREITIHVVGLGA